MLVHVQICPCLHSLAATLVRLLRVGRTLSVVWSAVTPRVRARLTTWGGHPTVGRSVPSMQSAPGTAPVRRSSVGTRVRARVVRRQLVPPSNTPPSVPVRQASLATRLLDVLWCPKVRPFTSSIASWFIVASDSLSWLFLNVKSFNLN